MSGGFRHARRLDTVQREPHGVAVAHVARLELDLGVEVVGPIASGVDLWIQVVEGAHLVPVGEAPVGEVRADEPCAAGDQNLHGPG